MAKRHDWAYLRVVMPQCEYACRQLLMYAGRGLHQLHMLLSSSLEKSTYSQTCLEIPLKEEEEVS
jgi:hypothetical protein